MPIVKIENINEDCTWGLWKIAESIDRLSEACILSQEEITELSKISNLQRQKEWLAARVILKTIIERFRVTYKGTRKDEIGKPHLIHNGFFISMAHSFPLAGAIVNRTNPCGIDIEKPRPALYQIAPRFLSEEENRYIRKNLTDLCLAWAAKEVLYKLSDKKNLSFRNNLLLAPYECDLRGNIKAFIHDGEDPLEISLEYEQFFDTLICHSI